MKCQTVFWPDRRTDRAKARKAAARPAFKKSERSRKHKPTYNLARKIADKFGGEAHLAKLIGYTRAQVYTWNAPFPSGSDGLIPTRALHKILEIAPLEGVFLTEKDLFPEKNIYD